jgi:hypothetical protein
MDFRGRVRLKQETEVKDCIMTRLRYCLQQDLFSDCCIVTAEGLQIPAHKEHIAAFFTKSNLVNFSRMVDTVVGFKPTSVF